MSLRPIISRYHVNTKFIAIVCAAGTLLVTGVFIPSSGAWFTDTKNIEIAAKTGAVKLLLIGADGTASNGDLAVNFNDLMPGQSMETYFTVQNQGSAIADLVVSRDEPVFDKPGADPSMLTFMVDDDQTYTPLPSNGAPSDLRVISPNQLMRYRVTVSLDPDAGNDWQNTLATTTLHLTLKQPRS